jgi:uncharacterized damage-inducible protein DinB
MSESHFDVAPLPGFPAEYGLLLATLQDSTREWKDELGEVDPDLICWQPYPKGYSIGGVLLHIAETEAYWIEQFVLGREISEEEKTQCMIAEIDQYHGSWPTPPREPLSYYYGILDRIRARTLESVKSFDPPETVKGSKWGTMTLRWVLAHVVGHDSYHGGQAVMLKELGQRMRPGT